MRVLPINNYNNFSVKTNKNTSFQGCLKKAPKITQNNSYTSNLMKALGNLSKGCLKLIYSALKMCAICLFFVIPAYIGQVRAIHKEYPQIEPTESDFPTRDSIINYSTAKIAERLDGENPREYSVHINDQKNCIISEALGKDSNVVNYAPLKRYYHKISTKDFSITTLHGHPPEEDGSTKSFSFTDFKNFIAKDDNKITGVVNKDKKLCLMIKTENYRKPTEEEIQELESKFDFFYNAAWPHKKTIYNSKGEVIFNIIDYPGLHDYWDFTTKKFGIQYITTFGTYGSGNDIYKNGYHEGFEDKVEVIE